MSKTVVPPFIRSPYNYDRAEASRACATSFEGTVSLTVQEHAEDADINVIVKRFGITGVMPQNHRVPEYGDYTGVNDYRSAIEAVRAADEHFMAMPAEVRARFENDPQRFMDFCAVPDNLNEMRKLGLAVPEKVADTTLRDVVDAVGKLGGVNNGKSSEGGAGD